MCARAPLFRCACLSVRRSVPLKQNSAQYDPCPAACVCVKQRRKGARRGETRRPERAGLSLHGERRPSNGIITRIQRRRRRISRTSERLSGRLAAQVSRLFREEATETNRDYRAGAALRSAGSSGISLQPRSSKLADTRTIKGCCVDLKEPDTFFYLEMNLFLERPFEILQ